MSTILIAILTFVGFIVAYNTYGRWLGSKIFELDDSRVVPSRELEDGVDFVPSRRSLVFGHHFTSIAGTGPIVGPAIAVFWGWGPALLWVLLGSIFIGGVHDLGALVVSLRNKGQTVGEIAGRVISPRAKLLFMLTLFFALTIVLAIFGLVIAAIFKVYPESVIPVWISLPVAILIGSAIRRGTGSLGLLSIIGLLVIYASIYVGAYWMPVSLDSIASPTNKSWNPTVVWTLILFAYCGVASVLPVWMLLQPRDYINSLQLFIALGLLVIGLFVACLSGHADLFASAPMMVRDDLPIGTPPIWPFLFITIACGAVSGFHCLVSSGTSSKQLSTESDALSIGYGSMLLEGALAVVVILACCAGVGMGAFEKQEVAGTNTTQYVAKTDASGAAITGRAAWNLRYDPSQSWSKIPLSAKVGAFIDGGANFLSSIAIERKLGVAMIAVLVACFAATTLDSATRLQRYVIQEIGNSIGVKPLTNKYVATGVALSLGLLIAVQPNGLGVRGGGGLMLWPLFGATNQLLAGMAFMVTLFWLWRRGKPFWFVAIPMLFMVLLPAWALLWQLFNSETGWLVHFENHRLLAVIAVVALALQIWIVVEACLAWPKARGVIEQPPRTSLACTHTQPPQGPC